MIEDPFIKGEERLFEFQVCPTDPSKTPPPVIPSAIWELRNGSSVISHGNCNVENDMVSMLVPFHVAGEFILEVRVAISPETLIGRMTVRVVE